MSLFAFLYQFHSVSIYKLNPSEFQITYEVVTATLVLNWKAHLGPLLLSFSYSSSWVSSKLLYVLFKTLHGM